MADDEKVDWSIVREILRYFRRNPQAADTIEGVARWRLLDERIERNVTQVSRAIEWLVGRGFLVQELTLPSTSIFRLNQLEHQEADRFLKVGAPSQRGKKDREKRKRRHRKR